MGENTSKKPLLTLPEVHREFGIGLQTLRREAANGSFPTYRIGSSWLRVRRSEFEDWLSSTRVPKTDHAAARVAELLSRESRAR